MGIDFSHCDAHWSYWGFNRFRGTIAEICGFEWPIGLDDSIDAQPLWDKIENSSDAIRHFLNHSDCDGELTVEQLKELVPRFKQVMGVFEGSTLDETGYDYKQGMKLLEGMESALAANEPLEFR